MEISQTKVDQLKQKLEFHFPEAYRMIFHPMFINMRGIDVDPFHAGIAIAAEKDLFPCILQCYLNLTKMELKNNEGKHVAMAGSVLMHAASVCLLLFFEELKELGTSKESAGHRAPLLMSATLLYLEKEYDQSTPTRTQ